ncbi:pentatricopeptide repeat-containing protein At3g14330 isoform X2 [Aristolochia californica]|uniref:pentatricopeptide repeat-containing protein At3g14330 isoform X2 n=1 Tax=Aristolochia californica TaxID=171875 RepID=UPI0035DE8081
MLSLPTNITVVSAPMTNTRQRNASNLKTLYTPRDVTEALSVVESPVSDSRGDLHLQGYSLLLHVAITTRSLQLGKAIHGHLLARPHLLGYRNLISKLITLYSVCGQIADARHLFDDYSLEDAQSLWVAMLIAYTRNSQPTKTLLLYAQMCSHLMGQIGNYAFSAALKASCDLLDLQFGRAVHAQIVKLGANEADQVVNNALLRLYAEYGSMDCARRLFEGMLEKNIVSWNTLLDAFARWNHLVECLQLFRKMQVDNIGFSWVTLTTVLSVCVKVSALQSGKEIHAQIVKSRKKPDTALQNSLMDLYAKCGALELSQQVFTQMVKRDLTSWNVMMTGYAIHGHSGAILKGRRLFKRMEKDFGIQPTVEHYACLVDLLGRSGLIEEALDVMENMPMSPSSSIWGSLLNSCRLHNNVELGEIVAKRLFLLEPNNAGNYVILSNMYAKAGSWEDAKMVRDTMKKRGIKKNAGCSWIQIGNRVHSFVAGGAAGFCSSPEYKKVWSELADSLRKAGYVPDTGVVLHDVDEDTKELWVCGHSERLAVVFGLVHTGEQMPIRITKNLRVCVDCHAVMKIISRITNRLIVLRDANRFHRFWDGSCSCNDYW